MSHPFGQRVIQSDADFQQYAIEQGMSPDGITAENFDARHEAFVREGLRKEAGLREGATSKEVRDALRAQLAKGGAVETDPNRK